MSKCPLISVIIPTYNSEKYIRRTLSAILNCHLNCEILVVDDGSTDNTCRILKAYENSYQNVKVFNKPNGGVSSARNLGLTKANGEYVLFIDADDLVTKNILLLEDVAKTHKVDVIRFNYKAQRIFRFWFKYKTCLDNVKEGFVDVNEVRRNILQTSKFNSVCFQLVRKEIIKNIRFDEKYIMAEDLDYNLMLYTKSKYVYYFPKPIIKYMYNSRSATRNIDSEKYKKQLSDMTEVYDKLYRYRDMWGLNIRDVEIDKHIKEVFRLYREYINRKGVK